LLLSSPGPPLGEAGRGVYAISGCKVGVVKLIDIIALDIATRTGWARGPLGADAPEFGSIKFGKDGASNGARFAAALRWSIEIFRSDHAPDLVAVEAPISVKAFKSQQEGWLLFGLAAVILGTAEQCGIRDHRIHDVRDIRNLFIGHKRLPSAIAKEAVMRRCRQLGWNVPDHNAGDAAALWAYQSAKLRPGAMLRRITQVGVCV
jgi:hypothetical protein